MRVLSVTESQTSAQFRGTFSRRKPSGELGATSVGFIVRDILVCASRPIAARSPIRISSKVGAEQRKRRFKEPVIGVSGTGW